MLTEDLEWTKEIKIEALPSTYRQAAELIGVERAILLHSIWGGLQVYFHKLDDLLLQQRDKLIRAEYEALTSKMVAAKIYPMLAIKYKLTERWIREIVDHKEDDSQPGLFG